MGNTSVLMNASYPAMIPCCSVSLLRLKFRASTSSTARSPPCFRSTVSLRISEIGTKRCVAALLTFCRRRTEPFLLSGMGRRGDITENSAILAPHILARLLRGDVIDGFQPFLGADALSVHGLCFGAGFGGHDFLFYRPVAGFRQFRRPLVQHSAQLLDLPVLLRHRRFGR